VRFFDVLNTPIGALSVLLVVVAVDVFLYFGYFPKTPTPLPAALTVPSATTIERTERAGPKERTQPERTRPERTRPATTLQSTTPTERNATVSATVSATSSPLRSPGEHPERRAKLHVSFVPYGGTACSLLYALFTGVRGRGFLRTSP
jgi:hypothetical protein